MGFLLHDVDRGEAEALVLAKELQADALIIDERTGYLIAKGQGIKTLFAILMVLLCTSEEDMTC